MSLVPYVSLHSVCSEAPHKLPKWSLGINSAAEAPKWSPLQRVHSPRPVIIKLVAKYQSIRSWNLFRTGVDSSNCAIFHSMHCCCTHNHPGEDSLRCSARLAAENWPGKVVTKHALNMDCIGAAHYPLVGRAVHCLAFAQRQISQRRQTATQCAVSKLQHGEGMPACHTTSSALLVPMTHAALCINDPG